MTDPESIRDAVVQTLDTFGRIDVLVNNAGYGHLGAFEEIGDEPLCAAFETNLFGALAVTRAVLDGPQVGQPVAELDRRRGPANVKERSRSQAPRASSRAGRA